MWWPAILAISTRPALVVRCRQMVPIRWLNRTTGLLKQWADPRTASLNQLGPPVPGGFIQTTTAWFRSFTLDSRKSYTFPASAVSIGTAGQASANSAFGTLFEIRPGWISLPLTHLSESPLDGFVLFFNDTINGMNLSPGVYRYNLAL